MLNDLKEVIDAEPTLTPAGDFNDEKDCEVSQPDVQIKLD